MAYPLFVVSLVLNTLANMLLKAGATGLGGQAELHPVKRVPGNSYLFLGLLMFAVNVVFYVPALTRPNLSIAYSVMVAWEWVVLILGVGFLAAGNRHSDEVDWHHSAGGGVRSGHIRA